MDLSAFYVDVTKDRMYTLGARSHERRSTQTAMYIICDGLARLLAPILPVTADDLWRHMPGPALASVHLEDFPDVDRLIDQALLDEWDASARACASRSTRRSSRSARTRSSAQSLGARVDGDGARGRSERCSNGIATQLPMLFNRLGRRADRRLDDGVEPGQVEVEKAPRREMRPLLALRAVRADRAGVGGHLRPLRRRAGRAGAR